VTLKRTPTLLLLTNETYVPWELAYLATPLDASTPPFLAAQTIMGRWIEEPQVMLPPTVSLDVKRITAVASEYGLASGHRQLVEAKAEQNTLCTQWHAVPLEATADEMEVMVTGAKIAGHLVHFAVHGYSDPAANNQTLLLADNTQLPASAMTGAYTCGATPRFSFVFLNACQVGTPGRSLGHAGGFPGVLVRGGTIGFIAPLWDVHDDIARAAAEAFYQQTFEDGSSVGAALWARRKTYDDDSTTPLAYIYYGHPGLRLNRST
jgi:CHAT domain-containing protein